METSVKLALASPKELLPNVAKCSNAITVLHTIHSANRKFIILVDELDYQKYCEPCSFLWEKICRLPQRNSHVLQMDA